MHIPTKRRAKNSFARQARRAHNWRTANPAGSSNFVRSVYSAETKSVARQLPDYGIDDGLTRSPQPTTFRDTQRSDVVNSGMTAALMGW